MLCEFSQHFPDSVAHLLERARFLRRKFREETVTDLLMASLVTIGGGSIIVEFPDEPSTGADMEWTFVNRDNSTSFQLLLQAKKLHDSASDWRDHEYRELFYRTGFGKTLQVEVLCNAANSRGVGTYPYYVFYNPFNSCELARTAGIASVLGVNICDGYLIRVLAQSKRNRTIQRSLGTLHPFLHPLSSVLCPTNIRPLGIMAFSRQSIPLIASFEGGKATVGRPFPPRPDQIRATLVELQNRTAEAAEKVGIEHSLPEIPSIRESVPEDIRRVLTGSPDGVPERLEPLRYWRVIFISENPRDQLGRPID
jgi:hypothetical protein